MLCIKNEKKAILVSNERHVELKMAIVLWTFCCNKLSGKIARNDICENITFTVNMSFLLILYLKMHTWQLTVDVIGKK